MMMRAMKPPVIWDYRAGARYRSALVLALFDAIEARLDRYARGVLLDAGCGTMPFRNAALRRVAVYESVDVERRGDAPTYLGDVQSMVAVPSSRYDTVLCSEVLEHLPRPELAVAEFFRVMRPEGYLVLSVPFLSRLHEEPRDYFRFTAYGLRELLERQGFIVEEVTPIASLVAFLSHQLSSALLGATHRVRGVRQLAFMFNMAFVTLPTFWLDRITPRWKLPAGYIAVARKPM